MPLQLLPVPFLDSTCGPAGLGQREEFVTPRGVPLEPLVKVVPLGERDVCGPSVAASRRGGGFFLTFESLRKLFFHFR